MVNELIMEKRNPAYKGWGSCMESFISNEEKSSMQSCNPQFTPEPEGTVEISWSSSDDESAYVKCKKKKVVTRLNFDECVNRPSGQVTSLYSRSLNNLDSVGKNKPSEKCAPKEGNECLVTPTKGVALLPADVDLPTSPVIMRRKRRRSFNNVIVSPVIKRSLKKMRTLSPELVDSPSSVISSSDVNSPLQNSFSDLITPLRSITFKQSTNITPALESMNLQSLLINSKGSLDTDEKPPKKPNRLSPSPLIEIASSQDVLMENANIEESDKIKEGCESQADELNAMDSQGIPLSAVITASASPSLTPVAMNESEISEGCDLEPSFSLLPLLMETPLKNPSIPIEDPESGRKKKRLKKGGLAIRLQRLLNREQSWRRMWRHERLGKVNSTNDSSVLLSVVSIWPEGTKVLVQCKVESNQNTSLQMTSNSVILLLDPVAVGERGIRPGCIIRLHPPWQTLMLNNNQIVILLCANLLEVMPGGENQTEPKKEKVITKEYSCQCIEGGESGTLQKQCPFTFEFGGLEFLSSLLPSLGSNLTKMEEGDRSSEPMLLSTQVPSVCTTSTNAGNEKRQEGTISGVVADRSQRGGCASSTCLIARIQRIFRYRSLQQKLSASKKGISTVKNNCMYWSALLQDAAGEMCEVEFDAKMHGSSLKPPDDSDVQGLWWGSTNAASALREGVILRLIGLKILKRSDGNKTRGLPAVMNAVRIEAKACMEEKGLEIGHERTINGQLFVYTFASEQGGSLEELNEDNVIPSWSCPLVHTLFDVLHGWEAKDSIPKAFEGQRVTVIVKVLFALPSGDEEQVPLRLFVTDPSLSALNSRENKSAPWVPFIVKPACCSPPLLTQWLSCSSLSNPVPVVCLQDVELFGGELIGDRYSRVFFAGEERAEVPLWISAHSDIISFTRSSLLPRVPAINPTSMPGEVVSIIGNVVGVDEETAFSWPACNMCGNDHLSEVQVPGSSSQQSVYHCGRCQTLVEKPFNKMSLDAFLACPSLPPEHCKVKVKLCQKSIMELLPPVEEQLGYELSSVLGKLIGPLYCLLVSTHKNLQRGQMEDLVFTAEELKCFVNM